MTYPANADRRIINLVAFPKENIHIDWSALDDAGSVGVIV